MRKWNMPLHNITLHSLQYVYIIIYICTIRSMHACIVSTLSTQADAVDARFGEGDAS